ncbi:MAG: cysteine desulfurase family protein [Gemmataceae bacterium]
MPIYLDYSSTTPLLPPVLEAMLPYFSERFGNPSSSHSYGRHARRGLDEARAKLAHLLDCRPDEILFTSGATEANNLALFGLAEARRGTEPGTILTSGIEHPCVTEPLARLAEDGFRLRNMMVGATGMVVPHVADSEIAFATLMLANHETGALQPVGALAAALGAVPLHCDAAAAVGKVPVSFRGLGAATLTLSAHKFHGPKGVGALIVQRGVRLTPRLFGGHQQQGKRPGTEPVPLIVGMAKALELALEDWEGKRRRVQMLRERFLESLREAEPIHVNGPDDALPHVLNVSFPGCKADALLMRLDLAGVACSTGSACSSGSLLPSPVLRAMGLEGDLLTSAMRFSFSPLLTEDEIDEAGRRVIESVRSLREKVEE